MRQRTNAAIPPKRRLKSRAKKESVTEWEKMKNAVASP
jgi:hypothetical protein